LPRNFRIPVEGGTLAGDWRDGTGTPLVLIHGFGGTREDWRGVIGNLPTDRPFVAYDQRGFGASETEPGHAYSHADDLLALLDSRRIAQADLCGMSLGGATALNFALDHPDRVRRLVLVSPLVVGWTWTSDWVARWKAIGTAARSGDMARARDLWWAHPLFETVRKSAAAEQMRTSIEAFSGAQWIHDAQRPALPDTDRVSALSMPTLLLTGEKDVTDFRMIADALLALSPAVTRIDHEDAGHMLNLELPRTIAEEIEAFLHNR
jgi:pimeloyl-ACP methyl ester carboxylesterase